MLNRGPIPQQSVMLSVEIRSEVSSLQLGGIQAKGRQIGAKCWGNFVSIGAWMVATEGPTQHLTHGRV